MIPIYENYRGYEPPGYASATVARILSRTPSRYLSGLQSVVLTNAESIGKGKTGRIEGRKYSRQSCLGFYHAKSDRGQAWVEIVVDNLIAYWFAPGLLRVLCHAP